MKKTFTRILLVLLALTTIAPTGYSAAIVNPVPVHADPDPATVKAALENFKNLSRKEKRERLKEAKKAIKELKAARKGGREPIASEIVQVICAIFIPPLGVYLHEGEINNKFWIDLLLTLLFFLPGMIYALIVVLGGDK